MKVIKIFLASSEEMDYDRMVFGNLIRRLDDVYEKRGIRLKLFEWEDYDSAFNDRRKQDEYNENVRESDIFLALFHKKAGQFTIEEFDVASETFKAKSSPKVYAYLKDLKPGEEVSKELEEFKRRMFDEMGHYWCRYDTRDSLQLQFVMQLQLVESSMGDNLVVENGDVRIDGLKVASMDRVKFASSNENYVKMSEELSVLPGKIEKAKERLQKYPDDEDLVEDLQQKLDHYNKLKKEFTEYQDILFDTAKRISRLQGEHITERMRRAMDAFNEGNVREANIILNEAEADAKRNLNDYKQSRMITEQKRQIVIYSLEELVLKISTVRADLSISEWDRFDLTDKLYLQALDIAQEVNYDKKKYAWLKEKYLGFLILHLHHCYDAGERAYKQGDLETAETMVQRGIKSLNKWLGDLPMGIDHSYELLGQIYHKSGDYVKALESYNKAIDFHNEIYVSDTVFMGDLLCPQTYNRMGCIYLEIKEFDSAIEYFEKALEALDSSRTKTSKCTALTYGNIYRNIGLVHKERGESAEAKDYLTKAQTVFTKVLGPEHKKTKETTNQLQTV
ncbi:MAG: tetratricopeptide repeat protein [Bacteroidales bacterium]|nr:tetratricopeptide repeat protein [Bacteroidales bacterium]